MFSSNTSQVSNDAVYIEDVFSTWLYTGNGSTQTITNGIDLSGKGGMVWVKSRSDAYNGWVFDTQRGANKYIVTNLTSDQGNDPTLNWSFLSNGFSQNNNQNSVNLSGTTYASWTFRKQPKFFDVVTYTGNGSARTISHNLGSTPGCIIVRSISAAGSWYVYHSGMPSANYYMRLNLTDAQATSTAVWNNTAPTSTVFSVGTNVAVNGSGVTYVAYLFAHDAGGFGLTGTDNVISCGSFTTDGSGNATVTLGYEPQWVLYKPSTAVNNWKIFDNMRGMVVGSGDQALYPNTSGAEVQDDSIQPAATGFSIVGGDLNATHIYIAIRRGPMKTPTSGTSVFKPSAYTGNGGTTTINAGFPIDLSMTRIRAAATGQTLVVDRLRGASQRLFTDSTTSESTSSTAVTSLASNTSITFGANGDTNSSGQTYVTWDFQRAPGFFDEVCYTGNATANTAITHNLTVVPELIITKSRGATGAWWTLCTADSSRRLGRVNTTNGFTNTGISTYFGDDSVYVAPTSTAFTLGSGLTNASGTTYVAYLFATVPGVSKVGTYTGNGSSQTINCGFTGGARFVLIKAASTTGDWYVWDTARGIVSANDPRLSLNTTAAEVTTDDSIDPDNSGFIVNQVSATNINVSSATYIYLAIA